MTTPIAVVVYDEATHAPVPGATVSLSARLGLLGFDLHPSNTLRTGPAGNVLWDPAFGVAELATLEESFVQNVSGYGYSGWHVSQHPDVASWVIGLTPIAVNVPPPGGGGVHVPPGQGPPPGQQTYRPAFELTPWLIGGGLVIGALLLSGTE